MTLAVAVGSTAAVFSLADAALLEPLPYPDSEHLGVVQSRQLVEGNIAESTSQNGVTWEAIRDGARTAVILGVAITATVLPARRILRLDPAHILRNQ